MATIILGGLGFVAGSLLGMPSLGFLVGTAIGRAIEGPNVPDQTIQGPRVDDLKVMASTYGVSIPIVYGQRRLAGNMIWATDIVERDSRFDEGNSLFFQLASGKGKSGPTTTTISYSYFANFAVGLAEGPIAAVTRIWANSKLVADFRAGGQPVDSNLAGKIRIYLGTETQEPDPIIQADVGIANTPAYRGLAYIVFDDFPLEGFGPPIPNIEVEVVTVATDSFPNAQVDSSQTLQPTDYMFSQGGKTLYVGLFSGLLVKVDVPSRTLLQDNFGSQLEGLEVSGDSAADGDIGLDGTLYIGKRTIGGDSFVNKYDADSWEKVAGTGVVITGGISNIRVIFTLASSLGPDSDAVVEKLFVTSRSLSTWHIVSTIVDGTGDLSVLNTFDVDDFVPSGAPWTSPTVGIPAIDDELHVWTSWQNGTDLLLTRHSPGSGGLLESFVLAGKSGGNTAIGYDQLTNSLVIANTNHFFTFDLTTKTIGADTNAAFPFSLTSNRSIFRYVPGTGSIFFDNGTTSFKEFDVATLTEKRTLLNTDWVGGMSAQFSVYDAVNISFIRAPTASNPSDLIWLDVDRKTGSGVTVRSIVEDISTRIGLAVSQVDAAGLTDIVLGYAITNRTTARSVIVPLTNAFFFDGIESDFKAKFKVRGSAPVATIGPDELGAGSEGSAAKSAISESRTHEVALPLRLDVRYIGKPDKDYLEMAQHSKRVDEAVGTVAKRTLDIPVVLDDDVAKKIADKALYTAWIERTGVSLATAQKFLALDPGDIVDVNPEVGITFSIILQEVNLGLNLVSQMRGVTDDAVGYVSALLGGVADGIPVQEISVIGPLAFVALDINSPDDVFDGLRMFYGAGSRGQTSFPGAVVFGSSDGVDFESRGTVIASTRNSILGTVTDVLGSDDGHSFDRINTVTVRLSRGTLSSVTELDVLNLQNSCVIGSEILQFVTATLNADGTYTLSNLLRGRRGTEAETGSHAIGDRFVLLDETTISSELQAIGILNQTRFFAAVPIGGDFSDAVTRKLTFEGRSLKPYSPVFLAGTRNVPAANDWTFQWSYRTRQGGENDWVDNVTDIANAEADLDFEVDIIDIGDGSVKRTITKTATGNGSVVTVDATDSANQKAIYDDADQVVDFGSVQATIKFRVYQLSSVVGRGFQAEATVTG